METLCCVQNKFALGQVDPSHFRNVLLNAEVRMLVLIAVMVVMRMVVADP